MSNIGTYLKMIIMYVQFQSEKILIFIGIYSLIT